MARLLFPTKVLAGVFVAFMVWQGWVFMRPAPREYTAAEQAAVRNLCRDAVDRVARQLPGDKVIGVAHFLDDPSDEFTATMREAASAKADWCVEEASIVQRFLADISIAVKNATSLDEIVNAGRRVGLDLVIAGKVLGTEVVEGKATARATVIAYDVKAGKTVLNASLSDTWKPTVAARVADDIQGRHPLFRLAIWLLLVLLLPVATPFATYWALTRQRNAASFGLLAAYTTADLVLGSLLAGEWGQGGAGVLWFCLAVATCAAYNYWICEKIAER